VVFPAELENESGPAGDFHKLEERRLAYVALTRAKQKLWLSAIDRKYKRPSPFFKEATGFEKDKVLAGIELVINDKHEKSEYDKNIEIITALDPARKAYEILNELRTLPADDGMISRARTLIAELRKEALKVTSVDAPKDKRREFLEAVGVDDDMPVDIESITEPPRDVIYDLLEILGTDEKPFSFSAIDTYKVCPLKFKFNYILRLPVPPQAALTFGSHMHALIEDYFKEIKVNNRRMEPDEVMALYKQKWDTSGYIDKSQERRYLSQGEGILDGFLKNSAFLACIPEAQEMKFNLDINGSKLIGFIDQINIYDDKSIEIIDFKTGKPKNQKSADESLQLSIYAIACRDIYGRLPEKVTFYNLTNNEKVSSSRTEEQLEETYNGLCADIDNILAEKTKGAECFRENPGFHCRWCSYNWVCPYQEE
jgi:DNA helicase-2/ATP-dependent DNA helicase PcrA